MLMDMIGVRKGCFVVRGIVEEGGNQFFVMNMPHQKIEKTTLLKLRLPQINKITTNFLIFSTTKMASLLTFSLGRDATMKVSGQHSFYAVCDNESEVATFKENNKQFLKDNNMTIYFDNRQNWLYILTHPNLTKLNRDTDKREMVKENITMLNKNLKTIFTEFELERATKTKFIMHCTDPKQGVFFNPDGSRYFHPMLSITPDLQKYDKTTRTVPCFVSSLTNPNTHQRLVNGLLKSCVISGITNVENITTSFVKKETVVDADGKLKRDYYFYHLATNDEGNPCLHRNNSNASRPTTPVGTKASLYSDENWDNAVRGGDESPVFASLSSEYKDALNKPPTHEGLITSSPSASNTPTSKSKKQPLAKTIPVAKPIENKDEVQIPKPVASVPAQIPKPVEPEPQKKLFDSITTTQTTRRTFKGRNSKLPSSTSIKIKNGEVILETTDDNINLEEFAEYLGNYFVNGKCNASVVKPVPIVALPPAPFNSINNKPMSPSQMDWSQMSDDDTEYASSDEEK
jgi:hypothetical protein